MASAAAFGPPALHIRRIFSSSTSPGVSPSPMAATGQVLGRSSRVTVVDLSRRSAFEIGSPARGVRAPPAAEVRPDKRVRAIPAHRRLHLPLLRRRQVLAAHGVHVLGVEDHAAFLELQRLAVLPAQLGERRVGVERASAPHASSRSSGRRPRRAHIRRAVCSGRRSASPGRPVLGPVARQGASVMELIEGGLQMSASV